MKSWTKVLKVKSNWEVLLAQYSKANCFCNKIFWQFFRIISCTQPNDWFSNHNGNYFGYLELIYDKKSGNQIIAEIHKAKYFALSGVSAPDVNLIDQLVFYVRYGKNQEPVEWFFSFILIEEHTSKHLNDTGVKILLPALFLS